MTVAKHLHLDVPRPLEVLFHQHIVVAEGRLRLATGRRQRLVEFRAFAHQAHALAAAARHRLEQHRVADLTGRPAQAFGRLIVAVVAGNQRHAGLAHDGLGGRLRAHGPDRGGRRADEHQPAIRAGFREAGVFGQESVTGVHGLRAGLPTGPQNALAVQVGFARRRGTDVHGLVGHGHVQHAASIAGLMITTEAMVAELPKKDEPMGGGDMGGMGCMGGMM